MPDIRPGSAPIPNVRSRSASAKCRWLQQVTFSIWPDVASMAAFARGGGCHGSAIHAVREGGWFREELYARFRILGEAGSWNGGSPLDRLEMAA